MRFQPQPQPQPQCPPLGQGTAQDLCPVPQPPAPQPHSHDADLEDILAIINQDQLDQGPCPPSSSRNWGDWGNWGSSTPRRRKRRGRAGDKEKCEQYIAGVHQISNLRKRMVVLFCSPCSPCSCSCSCSCSFMSHTPHTHTGSSPKRCEGCDLDSGAAFFDKHTPC